MTAKRSIDLMEQALESAIEHVENNPDPVLFAVHSERITYLPIVLIRPDPVQARRVLPEAIHYAFHAGQITPVQALQELVRSAQLAARQHGRPFVNVLDLLADLSSGSDEDADTNIPKYTPEELLVRDLVTLATTIRDDGQVNPLTIVDVSQGMTRLFRIETGERRYWATWLLQEFLPSYAGNGTIPCVIIKDTQASVFRQARENTARAGLSAIAMARQAALLLMAVHGIAKPDYAVDNDFYRQALDLDLRDKREHTDDVLAAMGGISRVHFSRYKGLLRLSDEAMELADRHSLEEGQLRYVLNLPLDDQAEMVHQIIQFKLTRNQIKAMCDQGITQEASDLDDQPLPKKVLQLARLTHMTNEFEPRFLAQALLKQESDVRMAIARLRSFAEFLQAVEVELANAEIVTPG